jgi:hypothetical protein
MSIQTFFCLHLVKKPRFSEIDNYVFNVLSVPLFLYTTSSIVKNLVMIGLENVYDEVLLKMVSQPFPNVPVLSHGACQVYISFSFTFITCVFQT